MNQKLTCIDPAEVPTERWDDQRRGSVSWQTLVSSDRTASAGIVCGLATFAPADTLAEHHHSQPEVVHIIDGGGTARLEGRTISLRAGLTLFLPSNVLHGFLAGDAGMRLLYTFATDSFNDINYRF